jgi:hypothetical protein
LGALALKEQGRSFKYVNIKYGFRDVVGKTLPKKSKIWPWVS